VEDLNLAPPDVLAALVPLLEGGALHLSHRSQVIRAAPGFQFIATVTAAPSAQPRYTGVLQSMRAAIWRMVIWTCNGSPLLRGTIKLQGIR